MKKKISLAISLFLVILTSYGQSKSESISYNNIIELEDTSYIIALSKKISKLKANNEYILFVNTENGESYPIDFPEGANIIKVKQIKIDSLNINKVIVEARTVNLGGKKSISWDDPIQLIILSTDGKEKVQITDNNFFVKSWGVNRKTGKIVIAGHYHKKKKDNKILIYDPKQMKITKII